MKLPHPGFLLKPLPLLILAVLATAAALLFYWQADRRSPEERYRLTPVEMGELTQTVSANGTLNPVTLVNVGTQVSGRVRTLHVDFNDHVQKDQILAELDDSLLSAQARQSEASLISAGAALDLARANEQRMRTLFAQEYVSRQELDQSVQALKAAQAQLRLAQAQFDKDRANLGYTIIRSPVSGVVVDRQVDVGQTVAASFQTPTLFKIAQDLSKMQIDSAFAEADIGNIRVGQPVRFNVDAFPDRSFQGQVKQIRLNPTNTSNVVTYNVVVSVDNPEQILLPGMTAYVNIAVARRENVLLVPNAALRYRPEEKAEDRKAPAAGAPGGVLSGMSPRLGPPPSGTGQRNGGRREASGNGGKGTVHVLRDGQVVPVPVSLGITDNRNTEVTGGELKAGDRVIVSDTPTGAAPASGGTLRMRAF